MHAFGGAPTHGPLEGRQPRSGCACRNSQPPFHKRFEKECKSEQPVHEVQLAGNKKTAAPRSTCGCSCRRLQQQQPPRECGCVLIRRPHTRPLAVLCSMQKHARLIQPWIQRKYVSSREGGTLVRAHAAPAVWADTLGTHGGSHLTLGLFDKAATRSLHALVT